MTVFPRAQILSEDGRADMVHWTTGRDSSMYWGTMYVKDICVTYRWKKKVSRASSEGNVRQE